jgi:hypothetical protein
MLDSGCSEEAFIGSGHLLISPLPAEQVMRSPNFANVLDFLAKSMDYSSRRYTHQDSSTCIMKRRTFTEDV